MNDFFLAAKFQEPHLILTQLAYMFEADKQLRVQRHFYPPIRSILADPSAKGVHYFNRMKWFGSWKSSPKPESEWGQIECAPIVSEALWMQANQILEEQSKAWKMTSSPHSPSRR